MTQPYLTIERFRVSGYVSSDDLDGLDDARIRSILMAASAKVDAWCNVPRLPQPFSFRGGTITDESHPWDAGDGVLVPASRRIFLRHAPVKAVTQCRIYVTNTQYVQFDANEIFINPELNCIEIVSLAMTASGLFGSFMVPNIGLGRPVSKTSYTYGQDIAVTDEQLEPTDGTMYRAVNQFWSAAAVTIKVNDVVQSSGFTLDRTEGTVTFDSQQAADAVVLASYTHTMHHDIAVGTAIVARDIITEGALREKGLGNIQSLKIGEISLDRGRQLAEKSQTIQIPAEAEGYLAGFRYITAR